MWTRVLATAIAIVAASGLARGADQKTTMKNLPAAVKATVEAESKGATITGISSEKENGKTRYEGQVRTKAGKTVAFEVDADGKPYKK